MISSSAHNMTRMEECCALWTFSLLMHLRSCSCGLSPKFDLVYQFVGVLHTLCYSSCGPSPPSFQAPAKPLTEAEKMRKVISELVDTEHTYVRHLSFLMKVEFNYMILCSLAQAD